MGRREGGVDEKSLEGQREREKVGRQNTYNL